LKPRKKPIHEQQVTYIKFRQDHSYNFCKCDHKSVVFTRESFIDAWCFNL